MRFLIQGLWTEQTVRQQKMLRYNNRALSRQVAMKDRLIWPRQRGHDIYPRHTYTHTQRGYFFYFLPPKLTRPFGSTVSMTPSAEPDWINWNKMDSTYSTYRTCELFTAGLLSSGNARSVVRCGDELAQSAIRINTFSAQHQTQLERESNTLSTLAWGSASGFLFRHSVKRQMLVLWIKWICFLAMGQQW